MKRVTGLGGVFLKCDDPQKMYDWYSQHLGLNRLETGEGVVFQWRDPQEPEQLGMTVWSLFPRDASYFKDSRSPVMLNYRVHDLDELLATLKSEGVAIDPHREDYDYGRFAWITDPLKAIASNFGSRPKLRSRRFSLRLSALGAPHLPDFGRCGCCMV